MATGQEFRDKAQSIGDIHRNEKETTAYTRGNFWIAGVSVRSTFKWRPRVVGYIAWNGDDGDAERWWFDSAGIEGAGKTASEAVDDWVGKMRKELTEPERQ